MRPFLFYTLYLPAPTRKANKPRWLGRTWKAKFTVDLLPHHNLSSQWKPLLLYDFHNQNTIVTAMAQLVQILKICPKLIKKVW